MFAISGRNLPRVRSYQDAENCWEHAHIHARFNGWRGLVNKRDTSKTIRKYDEGRIAFRYHHTDLVTWVSPTQIETTAHDSRSSRIFADAFLPYGVNLVSRGGRAYIQIDHNAFEGQNSGLTLNLIDNEWVPKDPLPQAQLYLNRTKAAAIRKAFKPWIQWRDSITKLQNKAGRFYGEYVTKAMIEPVAKLIMSGSQEAYTMECYHCGAMHSDRLLTIAYAILGAVESKPLPFGQIGNKTVYDAFI